jgi:hypothetical protein
VQPVSVGLDQLRRATRAERFTMQRFTGGGIAPQVIDEQGGGDVRL